MLNFLRKIRRKEMKGSKYLRYAIGEIFLVVVGILIALSISDWNDHRKKAANEKVLIVSLSNELENNIPKLNLAFKANSEFADKAELLIENLEKGILSYTNQEVDAAFDYNFALVDSPILEDIIVKNSDVLVKRKILISDFRALMRSYRSIYKSQFYLDEFWNSKVTTFFISSGVTFDEVGNDSINLKDFVTAGYSKKQLIALIKIKHGLHNSWLSEQAEALEKSKKLLKKLQLINSSTN